MYFAHLIENRLPRPDQKRVQTSMCVYDVALLWTPDLIGPLGAVAKFSEVIPSQNNPSEKAGRYPEIIYEETLSFNSVLGEVSVGMKAGVKQKKARRMNHA